MNLEFKGYIKAVGQVQSGTSRSGKQWQKVEFVVEEMGNQYPSTIALTLFGDKVNEFQGLLAVNTQVNAKFDAQVREYNGRWFTNLNCWKLEPLQAPQRPAVAQVAQQPMQAPTDAPAQQQPVQQQMFAPKQATKDDLPF